MVIAEKKSEAYRLNIEGKLVMNPTLRGILSHVYRN